MNSPLVHLASESLAKELTKSKHDDSNRLRELFKKTLARPPSDQEQQDCLDFLKAYSEQQPRSAAGDASSAAVDAELKSWSALCRVLITSNSFLYID
jgi:hypothetical protein